jgi:hypothetical protein
VVNTTWLAQVTAALGVQPPSLDAPMRVLHDWHARCVQPLLIDAMRAAGAAVQPQAAVQVMHERAAGGARIASPEWVRVLGPAMRDIYLAGYDYLDAYAVAHANAVVYADANGFTAAERDEFATYYAKLNTGASLTAFADANAIVLARAVGAAFADGDADAYARTYPAAWIRACVHAHAAPVRPADGAVEMPIEESLITARDGRRRVASERLAAGLGKSIEMAT